MSDSCRIITVGLNPAVDRVIEVPELKLGAHQTGREVSCCPGGKAFNVTRVIASFGLECIATGFLGRENESAFAPLLSAEHVIDRMIRLAGPTRVNITLADPVNHVDTHIRDAGLSVDAAGLEKLERMLDELVGPTSTVIFSGSLPPGMEGKDQNRLIGRVRAAGGRVVLDSHGPAVAELAEPIALASPNQAELGDWTGRTVETREEVLAGAESMLGRVEAVLVSLGAEGAMWIDASQRWIARLGQMIAPAVNTVGCGDALLGACIAARMGGADPAEALRTAVATASAAAISPLPAVFDPSVRDELARRIDVEAV